MVGLVRSLFFNFRLFYCLRLVIIILEPIISSNLLGNAHARIPLFLLRLVLLRELRSEVRTRHLRLIFCLLVLRLLRLFLVLLQCLTLLTNIEHELSHAASVLFRVYWFWLHLFKELGLRFVVEGNNLRVCESILRTRFCYIIDIDIVRRHDVAIRCYIRQLERRSVLP